VWANKVVLVAAIVAIVAALKDLLIRKEATMP